MLEADAYNKAYKKRKRDARQKKYEKRTNKVKT